MTTVSRCLLWCWAGLLVLLLVWVFLPLATASRWGLTAAVLLTVAPACWLMIRREPPLATSAPAINLPTRLTGSLVLVCGDTARLFARGETFRATVQGAYLATPTPDSLQHTVQWLAAHRPEVLPHLSLMLSVVPEQHQDEAALRGQLHHWRSAISQCRALSSATPFWLCGYFAAPVADEGWFVDAGEGMTDWRGHAAVPSFVEARQTGTERLAAEGRLSQALWLDDALRWLNAVVVDELTTAQTALPPLRPQWLAVRMTAMRGGGDNLWQRVLQRGTTLTAPLSALPALALPFPDLVLPLLPKRGGLTPAQRIGWWGGASLALFMAAALLASFVNNQRLTSRIGQDLVQYRLLDGTPPEPKLQAQQHLREDEQQLARYQRQGVPLSLGLGLYTGEPLYAAVQRAIGDWAPAASLQVPSSDVTATASQTVRLDSLSLFDTGRFQLKPSAIPVLSNALATLHAQPGWLIVVSGHTDATGNAKSNQALSLHRAEAVRDWIIQNSAVPASCFAVQGFGATQPVASNETAAGRAANRRVEITLVPAASACPGPETITRSPEHVTLLRQ
ncbi:conserved membrane hypothetical protein [Enterobacterales bacterium 8AC]|nr:conserved membrane hypothetical protein [Enterobacterales bacterium 8AC]